MAETEERRPSNPFVQLTHSEDNYLHSDQFNDAQSHTMLKEQWIRRRLKERRTDFTDSHQLSIHLCTWNVNGKLCNEDLRAIFCPEKFNIVTEPKVRREASQQPFDLYFVGLQEVDLSAESLLLNDTPREDYWDTLIRSTFKKNHPDFPIVKIASKRLAGIILYAYCRESLRASVTDVATDSKACGVLGFGNKGGVAIRMSVFNSSICVINSHLAADTEMVERRNADFEDICASTSFPNASSSLPPVLRNVGRGSGGNISIWDCDHLIWIGDLNYRITLPDFQAKEMLKSSDTTSAITEILKHDQLMKEKSYAGGAFHDFQEAPISFLPSYKFDVGTNTYDSSEKHRTPSWCDRILYRKGDAVKSMHYDYVPSLTSSDHKPVISVLEAAVTMIDYQRFQNVHQAILRDMDKLENDAMPDCKITTNSLAFGTVQYLRPVSRELVLENVGTVIAKARFIPKLQEPTICRNWMWINPPMAVLMPGEKLTIRFTILVDDNTVGGLNVKEDALDDILILHLENGKDFFISISGTFVPSCFGLDIRLLNRLNKPVSEISQTLPELWKQVKGDDLLSGSNKSTSSPSIVPDETQQIPKEIWRIVDYLYRFGIGFEGLFVTGGDQQFMLDIRSCLDSGKDFILPSSFMSLPTSEASVNNPEYSRNRQIMYVHSMAETLLRFLEALPNPVVPFGVYYQKCMDSYSSLALAKNVYTLRFLDMIV